MAHAIDTFIASYVETALWSSTDDEGTPLDENYGPQDIAPATLREMAKDCVSFLEHHGELVAESGLSPKRAGHDFWLTRNRHGEGFWDEGLGRVGDELTDAAHAYGSFDLYVGSDDLIHGS